MERSEMIPKLALLVCPFVPSVRIRQRKRQEL
jgi:hypothetical protein